MLQLFQKIGAWSGLTTARCPICGTLTNSQAGALCPHCAGELVPRTGGFCPTCGDIFGDEDSPISQCGDCRTSPPPWSQLYFHSAYSGLLRDLILGYKFNNGLGRTTLLADMAYNTFNKTAKSVPDAIIPVPLHRKRLLSRGYNQSTELCRTLARRLKRPVISDGLNRVKNTVPQTKLGAVERRENIKAAFDAAPIRVKGKSILLVDDVYTTGATLRECTRTLKRAGTKEVNVLVLARAMR